MKATGDGPSNEVHKGSRLQTMEPHNERSVGVIYLEESSVDE